MIKFEITRLHKFLICIFLLLIVGVYYKNYKDKHIKSDVIYMNTSLEKGTKNEKLNYIFSDFSEDLVEGSPDAKITIIEYYSHQCKYCRQFNTDVMPLLRKNFIDNGIIKFVHRAVYNRETILLGGMINCINNHKLKIKINDDFFLTKKETLNDMDSYVEYFINNYNISNKNEFKECYNSDRTLNKLLYNQHKHVQLLDLNRGVPLFVINNKVYRGYMDYGKINEILNEINLGNQNATKN